MHPLTAAGTAMVIAFVCIRKAQPYLVRDGNTFQRMTVMTAAYQINACGILLFSAGLIVQSLSRAPSPGDPMFAKLFVFVVSGATFLFACYLAWGNSRRALDVIQEDREWIKSFGGEGYFSTQRIDLAGLCVIMILPLPVVAWCIWEARAAGLVSFPL